MAYIRKLGRRKGVVYRAEVIKNNGRKISKSFRTSEEARRWARTEEGIQHAFKNSGISSISMNMNELFDKWFSEYASVYHSEGYQHSDRVMYEKYVKPILGLRGVKEIHPVDIQRVMAEMRRRDLSPSYANQVRQLMHKIFAEAVKTWRYVVFNPVGAVKPFRVPQKHVPTLNRAEACALLYWADSDPLGLGIHIALSLGLREGEVCGLKWDAVDFVRNTVVVRRKWQKKVNKLEDFAKGKKIRTIGISLELKNILQSRNARSEFVVSNPDGSMVTPSQLICLLRRGIKATGVTRVTFHGLRHTYASLFMQSGGDLYDLQKIMGHETVATTERYRHTDPEYLRKKCGVLNLYNQNSEAKTISDSAQIPPKIENQTGFSGLRLVKGIS